MEQEITKELIVNIIARTDALEAGLKRTQKSLEEMAADAKKSAAQLAEIEKNSNDVTVAMGAMSAAGVVAFAKIISAAQAGLQAYNETRSAIMGLRSQAEGLGLDFGKTLDAAKDLAKDGLISPADTNASIKNLLNYGFTLEQAEKAILRLKDAAAFGRQANYTLGEAVRVTTEGIRMENSVLSDAAGVQKNIAKMIEDYAKSLGRTTESLSQSEKAQAIYNGIMEETQISVGDAAKVSDELSGAQARQSASAQQLASVYGEALAPAIAAGSGLVADLQKGLADWIENNQLIAAGVTGTGAAIVGMVAAAAGIQTVISLIGKLKTAMDAVNAANAAGAASGGILALLSGPAGLVAAGVAVVAALGVGVVSAVESYKQKQKEAVAANQEAIKTTSQQIEELKGLKVEYETLRGKVSLTSTEKERLLQIERDLVEVYGASATGMDAQGRLYASNAQAIQDLIDKNILLLATYDEKERKRLKDDRESRRNKITSADAEVAEWEKKREAMLAYKREYDNFYDTLIRGGSDSEYAQEEATAQAWVKLGEISKQTVNVVQDAIKELGGVYNVEHAMQRFEQESTESLKRIRDSIEKSVQEDVIDAGIWVNGLAAALRAAGVAVSPQAQAVGAEIALALREGLGSTQALTESEYADSLLKQIIGSNFFTGIDQAIAKYDQLHQKISEGAASSAEKDQLDSLAASIPGIYQRMIDAIREKFAGMEDEAAPAIEVLQRWKEQAEATHPDVSKITVATTAITGQAAAEKAALDVRKKLNGATVEQYTAEAKAIATQKQATQSIRDAVKVYQTAKVGSDDYNDALNTLRSAYPHLVSGNDAATGAILDAADATDVMTASAWDAVQALAQLAAQALQEDINQMANNMAATLTYAAGATGQATLDFEQQAEDMRIKIAEMTAELQTLQTLAGMTFSDLPKTPSAPKARKSGGGSKSNKALDAELEALNHKKALEELTAREELEWLERIRSTRAKTAAERRSLDEKIYSTTKALIQEQIAETEKLRDVGKMTLDEQIQMLVKLAAQYQGQIGIQKAINTELEALRKEKHQRRYQEQLDALDQDKAAGRLSLEVELARLQTILEKYTLYEDERKEVARRIADVEIQMADARYQADLDTMNKQVQLGLMNLSQQIRCLEILREKYADNAQKLLEIDQMLFDKRLELQQQNISELDRLYEGVVQALTKKYQQEKRAEEEAVRNSIELRKQQSEAIIKGIEAQIAALDALDKAEQRGNEDVEYQDKRARLEASLASEKDAYNQGKIQVQIDKLDADYAEKKKKRERDDQKAALQGAIQTERDKINALNTELQTRLNAINKHYERELDTVKIRFEAEKVLAESTQKEILQMMTTYAPEYDLMGKSYGERMIGALSTTMTSGFDTMMQDLQRKFDAFKANLDFSVRANFEAVGTGVPAIAGTKGTSTTVNQTYNFNVPTANPLDVAAAGKKGAQDVLKVK